MRSSVPLDGAASPARLRVDALTVERIESERAAPAPPILADLHFSLDPGESAAVTGPSGAGKTTLLSVIAGLQRPDRGRVLWGDRDLWTWPERQRDRWRRDAVGLVFQDYQLFPELGVIENILLPLRFDYWRLPKAAHERARHLAAEAGIEALTARAGALSRGEQQRVAVARALMRRPALVLADEPTASLDADNGARVIGLLLGLAGEAGASVLIVTHDPAVLAGVDHTYRLETGRLSRNQGGTQ